MKKLFWLLLLALLCASYAPAQTGTGAAGSGRQSGSGAETSAHGKKTTKTSKAHKSGKKSKSASTQQAPK